MNKYIQPRPYTDPEVAARKIVEIANGLEPYMVAASWSSASTGLSCSI